MTSIVRLSLAFSLMLIAAPALAHTLDFAHALGLTHALDLVRDLPIFVLLPIAHFLARELARTLDLDLVRANDFDPKIISPLLNKCLLFHACLTTENYASRELKEKLLERILALPEE